MLIHEFRVPLNMTVDEFQIAQLYMVVDASDKMTGDGEGVEILKNEPFDNTDGRMGKSTISQWEIPRMRGQYTLKHYHFRSRIPSLFSAFCPEESMVLVEEAWNSYPQCTTVLTNGYLSKQKFFIAIDSLHLPDCGQTVNALKMSENELSKRAVEVLDIAKKLPNQQVLPGQHDPSMFISKKTGRGPLQRDWFKKANPIMTCYKTVRINFNYWGVQGRAERMILDQQRQLFHASLRQAHCLTDDWFGLSMTDIRRLEDGIVDKLQKKRLDTSTAIVP